MVGRTVRCGPDLVVEPGEVDPLLAGAMTRRSGGTRPEERTIAVIEKR